MPLAVTPERGAAVVVRPVESKKDLDAFIDLPYRLYRAFPMWVPPLRAEVRELLSDKSPFWAQAQKALYLAERGGRVVGRIAAIENQAHNEFHHDKVGFFGFFECEDDAEAASALVEAACAWLQPRGFDSARGPVNPSMGEECGVLVEGFDTPPAIMTAWTPPYYPALLEAAGLAKAKDLYAWWMPTDGVDSERIAKINARVRRRKGLKVRYMDKRRFEEELRLVQEIYNEAWDRNWGFVPMSPAEVEYTARKLKPILEPRAIQFLELDGRTVAMGVTLPDVNQALMGLDGRLGPVNLVKLLWRLKKIDRCRMFALGIRRDCQGMGLDAIMYYEALQGGRACGWKGGEMSWTLEDNDKINHGIEAIGGKRYKTFRIYERPLPA